jgi:hypothetical protein
VRFSAPVQTDPGALPAFLQCAPLLFPGVRRLGRAVNDPTPRSSTEVKERVELYLYSPSGSSWQVTRRNLPFLCIPRETEINYFLEKSVSYKEESNHPCPQHGGINLLQRHYKEFSKFINSISFEELNAEGD